MTKSRRWGVESGATGRILFSATSVRFFFFQAEDGIRDVAVTGVQTCALPISAPRTNCAAAARAPRRFAPVARRPLLGEVSRPGVSRIAGSPRGQRARGAQQCARDSRAAFWAQSRSAVREALAIHAGRALDGKGGGPADPPSR